MGDAWNPLQYERFKRERSQPFFDLMALVEASPAMRVVDLGCGTGELTKTLHERLGARETLGIDSSLAMLEKCNAHVRPGLRFEVGDLAAFGAGAAHDRFNLVFSNAALQWVSGHEALLGRLVACLAPRGQLAIQVPANDDHVSHRVAAEVAREAPFAAALLGYERPLSVLAPEVYATLLHRLGCVEQRTRLEVYAHVLASRDDVIEWVKGTLLTDYQKRMPEAVFAKFLERYRARLFESLADSRPHFYPFKRILFWGRWP